MPKGYFIVEVDVKDQGKYEEYLDACKGVVSGAGGRIIVGAGSKRKSVEGAWSPERFFVIEFPSYEEAKTWYYSDVYQKALALRLAASNSRAILVEEQEND